MVPNVNAFEQDLANMDNSKSDGSEPLDRTVVCLSAGTAAVHLALIACGVQAGDEVLVQSFTFCASSHPITYLGAKPVFVGSERETWNMDPDLLEPVFASVGQGMVRVLPATMNVLLLLAHMLDHFYCEGVGLRQLCDYTLFLDREYANIDRDRLEKALEELSMTRTYRVIGALCVRHLGLPSDRLMIAPTAADNMLADAIMRDCLKGGNFGRSDHPGRSTVWKWLRYYVRFLWRLIKFRNLCPSEALWWPLAKLYRLFTGTVHISVERSVLNKGGGL